MHWIHNAVFYNIYPLGFCGAPKFNDFKQAYRLDKIYDFIPHFKEMGVNAILFNPVFESTKHGYDTIDYKKIDSRLGDNASFKKICDTLHANGIRVLLDGVFNHVGRDFYAFKDIQEYGYGSIYCSWFNNIRFDRQSPYGDNFSYEGWAGHYDLVKLNLGNDYVVDYLLDAVSYWIDEFDIDGLRLDAANCMDINFFKKLKRLCKSKKEDFWMFGEIVGGDYNRWANADTLDSVTNYDIYKALYSCHNDRNYFEFAHSLDRQYGDWGIYKHLFLYNFADNHDVTRLASILRDKSLLKNVYTMLYTMPGAPSVYYGSEYGVEGRVDRGSDDDVRREMNLNDLGNPDLDLYRHICRLGKLKHMLPALQDGKYKNETIQLEHLCYSMKTDGQKLYVLLNQNSEPRRIGFNTGFNGWLTDVLNDNERYEVHGWVEINVAPHSSMILVENDGSYIIPYDEPEEEIILPAEEAPDCIEEDNNILLENIPAVDPDPDEEESAPKFVPEEIVPGRYRHFKGNEYEVIDFATDSETLEKMVIYRALYGERGLWVRPYEMFREIIERDGKKLRRFERIEK
jgi:glycosidase